MIGLETWGIDLMPYLRLSVAGSPVFEKTCHGIPFYFCKYLIYFAPIGMFALYVVPWQIGTLFVAIPCVENYKLKEKY